MTNSILPPEMTGVMAISGFRGIGKTYLAAQADAPENIAFFDFEQKAEGVHEQLHFGLYVPLTELAEVGNPVDLYHRSMEAFETLPQNQFTVAVLDNISPLELAMNAEAKANAPRYAQEFGLNLRNIVAGRYGGTKSIVNFMISSRISKTLHERGVQLIIAISHIGSLWSSGGPVAGKYRTKGADRWQELSILSLILVPGDHPPVPAALVQKEQLGVIQWDAEKRDHIVRRRLPYRIPKCTFAAIRGYLSTPADLDDPPLGEEFRQAEFDTFSERLSQEQIALMRLSLQQQQRDEGGDDEMMKLMAKQHVHPEPPEIEMPEISEEQVDNILTLWAQGKKYPEIAREMGLAVPVVVKIVGSKE